MKFCQIRLIFICLLLAITSLPSRAQSHAQLADYLRTAQRRTDYASLSLQIDRSGSAQANLWLPVKANDREAVQRALAESLGFPLEFGKGPAEIPDADSGDDYSRTAQPSWFSGKGQ